MPIPAQYSGKCKDCGISYAINDMIDVNGQKSPNKNGEMKDHWCKNGTNCQGAQALQGPVNTLSITNTNVPLNSDSLRKVYDAHLSEIAYPETMDIYIKALRDCEIMGIPYGVASGHYQNLVVRRMQ